MTDLKQKNYSVELFRFLFCVIIIHYHFRQHFLVYCDLPNFFARSYLGDEFFFIVTGYFLSEAAIRTDKSPIDFSVSQLLKRLAKTALPYYLTWLLCFLGTHITLIAYNAPANALINLANSISELCFIEVFGFLKGFYSNGLSWFFSALLVVCFLIGPLAAHFKQKFSLFIAPVISLFAYGVLSIHYDLLFRPSMLVGDSFLTKGFVRALAAICAGCFIHGLLHSELYAKYAARMTKDIRRLIGIISIALWTLIFYYMVYPFPSNYVELDVQYDFIVTFAMVVAMIPMLGNLDKVSDPRAQKVLAGLGQFAFFAYFGQAIFYSFDILIYRLDIPAWTKYAIMLALITLFSYMLALVNRAYKNRKKNRPEPEPVTVSESESEPEDQPINPS